ncbi:MAG TPA: hypothetical protein VKJ07_22455, partial [Mycobacteriales bacterium]|nr:hypothetical protein [Mycobacteriales bacterium]
MLIDQLYTAPPTGVAVASALAPVRSSPGASMMMAGQVPMSVVAEALLFDEFGSAAGDTALTVSCTDTAAAGEMSQALMIVALCPELSAAMVQGKLPRHAPLFALNVSPG